MGAALVWVVFGADNSFAENEKFNVSGILSVVAAGLFIRFDRTGVGPNV